MEGRLQEVLADMENARHAGDPDGISRNAPMYSRIITLTVTLGEQGWTAQRIFETPLGELNRVYKSETRMNSGLDLGHRILLTHIQKAPPGPRGVIAQCPCCYRKFFQVISRA
jgi:hypothetical protein